MEQRIDEARAELEAVRQAVARTEGELREASVTMRSPDGAVEVTVGAQGELTRLRFPNDRYRSMSADRLAASVLETANRGRAAMAQRVISAFEPLTRPAGDVPGFRGIDVDWERLFGPALSGVHPSGPGRSPGDRLRDEIYEDTDDDGADYRRAQGGDRG
ncbi:hypothetical protein CUT44_07825 [Streptomyces carminius]|uniref:YbaB/EbfC family DNA-binding protein n=1 Tax=Streptomyces carminius TaxID=2665496 RepID=A0A2M8M284_9ACTN|nr:hypothetical protein CUT44_07825 [Streptomyces carminius]